MSSSLQTSVTSPTNADEFAVNNPDKSVTPWVSIIPPGDEVLDDDITSKGGSINEFKTVDCVETKVCIDEAETFAEKNNETLQSTSCENEASCDANPRLALRFWKWCNKSKPLYKHVYEQLHNLFMFVLPLPALFLGSIYKNECLMSAETPILLVMMGLSTTLAISFRIWQSVARKVLALPNLKLNFDGMIHYTLLLLFNTEQICFFLKSPSFELGDRNYCHRTFYYFTFYWNLSTTGVLILLLILWIPVLRFTVQQIRDKVEQLQQLQQLNQIIKNSVATSKD